MFSLFNSEDNKLNQCQINHCFLAVLQIILILVDGKYIYDWGYFIIMVPPLSTILFYSNIAIILNFIGLFYLGVEFKNIIYEGIEVWGTYGWAIIIGFFLCANSIYNIFKDDQATSW